MSRLKNEEQHVTETMEERAVRLERARSVVAHEWEQFQLVRGEDGRASCQDNPAEFEVQRLGQFMTWPMPLLNSYASDLDTADAHGRNLLTVTVAEHLAQPRVHVAQPHRLPAPTGTEVRQSVECGAARAPVSGASGRSRRKVLDCGKNTASR